MLWNRHTRCLGLWSWRETYWDKDERQVVSVAVDPQVPPPPSVRRWFSFPLERMKWRIHTLVNTRLSYSKYRKIGTGEVTQWLNTVSVLAVDRNSGPSNLGLLTCDFSSRDSDTLFLPYMAYNDKQIKNKSTENKYWILNVRGLWLCLTLLMVGNSACYVHTAEEEERPKQLFIRLSKSLLAHDFSEVCNQPVPACGHSF